MQLATESKEDLKVCAVVAKDFRILSTGVRGRTENSKGKPIHAEREAIESLSANQLTGSTLYTTLEPCIRLHENQAIDSCSDLICKSGIQRVVIGVLDPRGEVYTFGWRKLLDENIEVDFFPEDHRGKIDSEFLREESTNVGYGPSSKVWTIVPDSGAVFKIYKNKKSDECIEFSWQLILKSGPTVDIIQRSEGNHSVTLAKNITQFDEVKDWRVFKFWGHAERLYKKQIVVAKKNDSSWAVLLRVLEIEEYSIRFQYKVFS